MVVVCGICYYLFVQNYYPLEVTLQSPTPPRSQLLPHLTIILLQPHPFINHNFDPLFFNPFTYYCCLTTDCLLLAPDYLLLPADYCLTAADVRLDRDDVAGDDHRVADGVHVHGGVPHGHRHCAHVLHHRQVRASRPPFNAPPP